MKRRKVTAERRVGTITMRVTHEERAAWSAAAVAFAANSGKLMTLTEYVRAIVNADASARAVPRSPR